MVVDEPFCTKTPSKIFFLVLIWIDSEFVRFVVQDCFPINMLVRTVSSFPEIDLLFVAINLTYTSIYTN